MKLQSPVFFALLATLVATSAATPLAAHVGAPEGRGIFLADDGSLIGAGTTWGVIETTAEGFIRTCEEAVGDTVHFYYWAKEREEVVVGTNGGVLTSTDWGCSWETTGLEDRAVTLLRTPRDQPGVLFASTSTTGDENGVFRSLDDGATWAATSLSLPEFAFTSLQVSVDGQLVVASGIDYAVTLPRIFLSTDGGATFEEKELFPAESNVSFINAVGITDDAIAIATLRSGEQGSTLYLASRDLETLGEGTAFDTDEANGVVTDYALFDGTEYVLVNRSLMHKREAGELAFSFDEDGPGRCLIQPRESDRLWGCAQPFQLGHFLFVEDADDSWSPAIPHLEVEERRCPEGTIGEERCRYLFEPGFDGGPVGPEPGEPDAGEPETNEPEPEPGPSEPDPPPDCGCEQTGGPPAGAAAIAGWVALAMLGRRSRRKADKSGRTPDSKR